MSVFGATGHTTPRSRHRSIVSGGTDTPNAEASSTSEPDVMVCEVMNSKRALIGSVSTSGSGETEMSRIVIVFGYPLPQEVMGETEVDGAAETAATSSTFFKEAKSMDVLSSASEKPDGGGGGLPWP